MLNPTTPPRTICRTSASLTNSSDEPHSARGPQLATSAMGPSVMGSRQCESVPPRVRLETARGGKSAILVSVEGISVGSVTRVNLVAPVP
jgi:hypothetical protein